MNFTGGENDLSSLRGISESDKEVALVLIKSMIADNPTERPPASAVHNYPIFWSASQILNFFQVFLNRNF